MPLKKADYTPNARGPLSDVRVLDLSRLFAGNVLTQMLGDYGADVIKVEPPDGDTLRAWQTAGVSTHWKIYSRNKRSLALDLRRSESIELIKKLVSSSAIFIESFRPGVLEKMGLSPDQLLALNPKLVIVRISGWGQDGPYSQRPGFGTIIEGMSGFASFNGFADREPVLPPMYLADGVAGLYGASAVMIALREVEQNGGRGQVIDLPLLDPLFSILSPQAANFQLTGKVKPRTGSRSTNSAPRNVYRCRDGAYVALSGSTQGMAERLFRAIGRADLISNPLYATNAARVKIAVELDKIIADFIGQHTQAENVSFFEGADVTVGPIYDMTQIIHDPHFIEREILAEYPDVETGTLPMHHVVPRLLGTPGSIRSAAPGLGANNEAILAEIGVDAAAYGRIASLWSGRRRSADNDQKFVERRAAFSPCLDLVCDAAQFRAMDLNDDDSTFLRDLIKNSRRALHHVKWVDRDGTERVTVLTNPEAVRINIIAQRHKISKSEVLRQAAHIPVAKLPPA